MAGIEALINKYLYEFRMFRVGRLLWLGFHGTLILGSGLGLARKVLAVEINWLLLVVVALGQLLLMALGTWLVPLRREWVVALADRNLGYEAKLITWYQLAKDQPDHAFRKLVEMDVIKHAENHGAERPFKFRPRLYLKVSLVTGLFLGTAILWPVYPAELELGVPLSLVEEPKRDLPQELARDFLSRSPSRPSLVDMEAVEFMGPGLPLDFQVGKGQDELKQRLAQEIAASQEVLRRRLDLQDRADGSSAQTETGGLPEKAWEEGLYQASGGPSFGEGLDQNSLAFGPGSQLEGGEFLEGGGGAALDGEGLVLLEDVPDVFELTGPGSTGHFSDFEESEGYEFRNLDYIQHRLSSQVTNDSYITAYLDELLPPLPGIQEDTLDQRLVAYRTDLLNQMAFEEIPAAYRDLIREYFSLLALE